MFELNKIYQGNALEILKTFPSEIIDCVVTSPPYYGLRLYGNYTSIFGGDKDCEHNWTGANRNLNDNDLKEIGTYSNFCNKCNAWKGQLGQEPTFQMYLDHLLMIFGEIKRVLKSTGTIFVNLGDSYSGSMNGKGDKTSTNRGKDESYKQKYQGQNPGKQIKDKCLLNIPSRFAIRMTDELGFIQRNEIIWWKRNSVPSSVKDRFTIDFEKIYFFVKSKKYYFEQQFEPVKQISIDRLNRALSNQNKWAKGCEGQTPQGISRPRESKIHKSGDNKGSENNYAISTYKFDKEDYLAMPSNSQGRNKRCVWDMPTKGYSGAHFATFSTSLIEPMIKAGCPEFICNKCEKPKEKIYYSKVIGKQSPIGGKKHVGNNRNATYSGNTKLTEKQFLEYTDCECNSGFHGGIVLDPFMGAGTTAKETIKQNKNYIGIEINPKYVELSNKRLEKINKQIKIKYD